MKFTHSISIILALAVFGLSLPARADQTSQTPAPTNDVVQDASVDGSHNKVNQHNRTSIRGGNNGTSIRTRQSADVLGNKNKVKQTTQSDAAEQRPRSLR